MGGLTFELRCTQRLGATVRRRKMGRRPSADWTARQAVGCQLERRVRLRVGMTRRSMEPDDNGIARRPLPE